MSPDKRTGLILASFFSLMSLRCVAEDTSRVTMGFLANSGQPRSVVPIDKSRITLIEDGRQCGIGDVRLPSCPGPPVSSAATVPPGAVILLLDAWHYMPQNASTAFAPNANTEPLIRTAANAIDHLPEGAPVAVYSSDLDLRIARDIVDEQNPGSIVVPRLSSEEAEKAAHVFERPVISKYSKVILHLISAEVWELYELESIANHVAKLPGRKTLVWFCEGTPFQVPPREGKLYYPWFSAMTAVQRANLAIYPVLCDNRPSKEIRQMADLTGGRFYDSYNKLRTALDDALHDSRCSYTLSWTPTNGQTRPIHNVRLESSQRGIRLLYPHSYIERVTPAKLDLRLKEAEAGLATPLRAYSIAVKASLRAKSGAAAQVLVSITDNDVDSYIDHERPPQCMLDVIYAYYDDKGNRLNAGIRNLVKLNCNKQAERQPVNTYTFTQDLLLPPETHTLRIVARDAESGAIGSVALSPIKVE